MGNYQRFVAYVYEYLKGKKEKNCGFVKVEVREGVCSMELKLRCPGLAPETECRIYGFVRKEEALEGVLLGSCRTEAGVVSCQIRTDADNLGGRGVSLGKLGGMAFVTELGAFFGTEWDDKPIRPEYFRERAGEDDGGVIRESEEAGPLNAEGRQEDEQQNIQEAGQQAVQEAVQQTGQDNIQDAGEMRAEEILGEKETEAAFMPFNDGEFEVCKKISPQDLLGFSRRECALRHNRFLAYGYYNFGHLLLGKRADGRYVLGVPGRYDQQEQFMAGMFGFPYFKESAFIRLSQGNGGYWYRLINAPDADGGNSF